MDQRYTSPTFKKKAFHCPLCNVYANQSWDGLARSSGSKTYYSTAFGCICAYCNGQSIWYESKMLYPDFKGVQLPNQDLSKEIQADYQEAASILQKSPRGAAAILRLSIQKLCKDLGESGKNINDDIKNLVSKGLPAAVQQSLDAVRVIGNNAVHPGQIDLRDNVAISSTLFKLINFIAEKMITEPKEIQAIYMGLPKESIEHIKKRDSKITK